MKHLVCVVLLLLLVPACSSSSAVPPGASSVGFPAPDQELVYHTALGVLARYGHTPDMEQSSSTTGIIVSRWKNSLQPFSNCGYREQITVTIRPCPGRASYYTTETQAVRQNNANMQEPDSLIRAKWGPNQPDPEMEDLINSQIEMTFLPGSLSPEFRKRHGLGARDIQRPVGR